MAGAVLVDTGFLIALYEPRDEHHAAAVGKSEWLDLLPVALPWPVLYETVNTRLSRNRAKVARFDALVQQPGTELVDDTAYRADAYRIVVSSTNRHLSLVDAVLRLVVDDPNVPVAGMLTFNPRDFADVCRQNAVELL